MFLHGKVHGNDGDCGFTTTKLMLWSIFYKATGLIMGKNHFKLLLDDKIMVSK